MPQDGPHKGDFFAVGIYGQYIYVNPAHNIVIAKNAADREFTQNGTSGQTSIGDNIDMFRSLAAQLSVYNIQVFGLNGGKLPNAEELNDIYKRMLKEFNAQKMEDNEDIRGDFGEIFGIASSEDLNRACRNWREAISRYHSGDIGELNSNLAKLSNEMNEVMVKENCED